MQTIAQLQQEINSFICQTASSPKSVKPEQIMSLYDAIFIHCNSNTISNNLSTSADTIIKGADIYGEIEKAFDTITKTEGIKNIDELFKLIKRFCDLESVYYATFRYLDRFYVKYGENVPPIIKLFRTKIFHRVLENHQDKINELIMSEFCLWRKGPAEYKGHTHLGFLVKYVTEVTKKLNITEISEMKTGKYSNLTILESRYLYSVESSIPKTGVISNGKYPDNLPEIINFIYTELKFIHAIFSRSVCSGLCNLLKNHSVEIGELFRENLKNQKSNRKLYVVVSYMFGNTRKIVERHFRSHTAEYMEGSKAISYESSVKSTRHPIFNPPSTNNNSHAKNTFTLVDLFTNKLLADFNDADLTESTVFLQELITSRPIDNLGLIFLLYLKTHNEVIVSRMPALEKVGVSMYKKYLTNLSTINIDGVLSLLDNVLTHTNSTIVIYAKFLGVMFEKRELEVNIHRYIQLRLLEGMKCNAQLYSVISEQYNAQIDNNQFGISNNSNSLPDSPHSKKDDDTLITDNSNLSMNPISVLVRNFSNCDTKKQMIKTIESFQTPLVDSARVIQLISPFSYLHTLSEPTLTPEISRFILNQISLYNKTYSSRYKLQQRSNLSSVILKINTTPNPSVIRIDLVAYNIIDLVESGIDDYDRVRIQTNMDESLFDHYITIMIKSNLIVLRYDTEGSTVILFQPNNPTDCFSMYESTTHTTASTKISGRNSTEAAHTISHAYIMREMKIRKRVKTERIPTEFGEIEDIEDRLKYLIEGEYLAEENGYIVYK